MAAQQALSVEAQITQLDAARNLVLGDPNFYPDIVKGIMPIVSAPHSVKELRRWGSNFLAETFASPVLNLTAKQSMAITVLDPLLVLVNETESITLKNAIQCSASIYPLIFRYICSNRNDSQTWEKMIAIKSRILKVWDRSSEGVRLACIKFVQKVILVQTPGTADPRLADKSEVSLTNVPLNHPLIPHPSLEAEAQGLLDRFLNVLQQDRLDVPAVNATLNCLPILIKTRTTISNKILNAILNFDPFSVAHKSNSFKDKFAARSMEKTARSILIHLVRSAPSGPNVQRISAQINRLLQGKAELVIEDTSKKRGASVSDVEPVKRMRTDQEYSTPTPPAAPPIQLQPSNGTTYSTLFTLTDDLGLSSFDVQQLPIDIVIQITLASVYSISQQSIDNAISTVRSRYNSLLEAARAIPPPQPPQPPPVPVVPKFEVSDALRDSTPSMSSEESDEYEVRDSEPVVETQRQQQHRQQQQYEESLVISSLKLAKPDPLSSEELKEAGESAVDRMFGIVDEMDRTSNRKSLVPAGKLAASTGWDKDGWVGLLCRLSTRSLETVEEDKNEEDSQIHRPKLSDFIREKLYSYIMVDFRGRMDTAVAWLNEEWYNDQVSAEGADGEARSRDSQYMKWMLKVMDGIFPFLEASDRIFLRFLSDLPEIPAQLLQNLRNLCLDPERSSLGFLALHYLTMLKPPVKSNCLDIVEDLYLNHADVKTAAKKILIKFKPQIIIAEQKAAAAAAAAAKEAPPAQPMETNGTGKAAA